MTPAPAPSRPFAFDQEFAEDGRVMRAVDWRPAKRAYLPAEVEALVAQAAAEARAQALAEVEGQRAAALAVVADGVARGVGALSDVARRHREESAGLALSCGRVLASAALERFPAGAVTAAIEALGREIEAQARLTVRAAGLDEEARRLIEDACAQAGHSGAVVFRDDPAMPPAAFELGWADGRAEYDPEGAARRLSDALNSALAAEAGHAEPLNLGA
ncbi:MAG: flagellar assembly protein FlbE [Alphaproteobacteria bacterium]|nr:flagellar assembly protein FlbE [Alphaproteobacteria bacterium]MBU1526125.1 flagellar assembly protein FlbE [Alphaproteobacteria bacterium]MBU2350238.1 flagellar assembly protein FlbE [Alphaproteobacteria bacterium]MBU2381392.1 flagellar assembly protein FlbE [Alphaproteobacteria bacterium]